MKRTKLVQLTALSLTMTLVGVPALAQQPAAGGTLLVSAPGALGAGSGKPSPASTAAKPGAAQGEAKPQVAAAGGSGSDACSAESPEGCSESEAPRTGLLTDTPAPRAGASSYGSMGFSSPSYGGGGGGGGGTGISPRTFSAAAGGGGMGSPSAPFVPGPGSILPSPGLLPNICLP